MTVKVFDFLLHVCKHIELTSLVAQCCLFLSILIEKKRSSDVKGAKITRADRLTMQWVDEAMDDNRGFYERGVLNRKLTTYVSQTQVELDRHREFCLVTDKGSGVGSMTLQNTFITAGDNFGAMAIPQARFV